MTSVVEIAKDFFCGLLSGWGQVVTMLPFEKIKLAVVTQPEKYNQGYIHAFKTIVAEEGFLSFYKGMLLPLIGVGALAAIQFGVFESLKKLMKTRYQDS
jgi:solute carrier family 25 carnitine/acylcarnitine transporter 20/29